MTWPAMIEWPAQPQRCYHGYTMLVSHNMLAACWLIRQGVSAKATTADKDEQNNKKARALAYMFIQDMALSAQLSHVCTDHVHIKAGLHNFM